MVNVVVVMVNVVIMVTAVIKVIVVIMLIRVVVVFKVEVMVVVILCSVLLNMTCSSIRRTLEARSCATIRADMNLWGSSAVGKGKKIPPLNKTSSGCKLEPGSQVRSISRSLH